MFKYILSDYKRVSGINNAYLRAIKNGLFGNNRGFKFLFWFRLAQNKSIIQPFAKIIYQKLSVKYCIDFPLSIKVGYGLYLGHGMCIVVNGNTIIGNNVNLSQFINIGSNSNKSSHIGDNVYIGPHVCIVDGVFVGDNVTIGAGAIVTKDIAPNATAVGAPAKIVHFNNAARFIYNKYHLEAINIDE